MHALVHSSLGNSWELPGSDSFERRWPRSLTVCDFWLTSRRRSAPDHPSANDSSSRTFLLGHNDRQPAILWR